MEIAFAETQKKINELYGEIDCEVYRAYFDSPLLEVEELISEVTALHQTIQTCDERIKAINSTSLCLPMRSADKEGMLFCGDCGCRITEVKPPEAEKTCSVKTVAQKFC